MGFLCYVRNMSLNSIVIQKIKEMIESGFSISRICVKLDLKKEDVTKLVKVNNWTFIKKSFNNNEISKIISLYDDGVSAKSLGQIYSIDKRRVQKWADENGVLRLGNDARRFTFFNDKIFDIIDSPDKAYWLGFLYADGFNSTQTNTVNIGLKGDDEDYLKLMANFFELNKNKVTRKIRNDGADVAILSLYSQHLCQTLDKLGCMNAKSFKITFPSWLNKDLYNHFIRGIFDGDGSISMVKSINEWSLSFVGTSMLIDKIKDIFEKINIKGYIENISLTENNTTTIKITGNQQVLRACHYIYNNSVETNRLNRKYNLYKTLELIQNSNKNVSQKFLSKEIIKINNIYITKEYVSKLTEEERENLVEPIFNELLNIGWNYPKWSDVEINSAFSRLVNWEIKENLDGNNLLATNICKHFCSSFYHVSDKKRMSVYDAWNDEDLIKKVIKNRLMLTWKSKSNEWFDISPNMIIQGMRSMGLIATTSLFKPTVAKAICLKYSKPGDLIGDYSAGFGARLLGAASCNRRYFGMDPLTKKELDNIIKFLNLKDCEISPQKSEEFIGEDNIFDFCWSSPPYYNIEIFSKDKTFAYNHNKEYFLYNYWKPTLINMKKLLKPNCWFGVNVSGVDEMIDLTINVFGNIIEKVPINIGKSHFNKKFGNNKQEFVFMFKNIK